MITGEKQRNVFPPDSWREECLGNPIKERPCREAWAVHTPTASRATAPMAPTGGGWRRLQLLRVKLWHLTSPMTQPEGEVCRSFTLTLNLVWSSSRELTIHFIL